MKTEFLMYIFRCYQKILPKKLLPLKYIKMAKAIFMLLQLLFALTSVWSKSIIISGNGKKTALSHLVSN